MPVIGIDGPHAIRAAGVDLCDVDRLRLAVDRTGPALARRVFTAEERGACADGSDPTAAAILFGIKESVIKLVGGLQPGTGFRDIRIGVGTGPDPSAGRMPVELAGGLAEVAGPLGVGIVAGGAPHDTNRIALCWAIATEPAIDREAGC
jgi:phosphopantetheinyl transferase (holo-ACP synthase)